MTETCVNCGKEENKFYLIGDCCLDFVGDESEQALRNKISREIMDMAELLADAKELGPDAYLVAHRTRMACAAIVRGLK